MPTFVKEDLYIMSVTIDTNKLVTASNLTDNIASALNGNWPKRVCPPLWDGKTAQRAVECLRNREENQS